MINRYTVLGQPIAHSLSPAIHHMFGELTQRRIHYTRTEATPDTFEQIAGDFLRDGGKGCNVTAPFKQQAANLCSKLNESARLAQAVNTIEVHRDGNWIGHNTDGTGLLFDIQHNKKISMSAKRILLLGAGGAARGVLAPLLKANPELLHIANRTVERAQSLCKDFEHLGPLQSSTYDELTELDGFDIIINATSMGFNNEAPPAPATIFRANSFAYDMMYRRELTPFLQWCKQQGVDQVSDGFGMLVEQAADAYLIWEGVRPKTRKVYINSDNILNSV